MIGDYLYRLTPRDEQTTPIDLIAQLTTVSVASAGPLLGRWQVPRSQVLDLTFLAGYAVAGAAQTVSNIFLTIQDPNGQQVWNLGRVNPVALDGIVAVYPNRLIVPSGFFIQVSATFNAGVAINQLNSHIGGVLLPRGNTSLGFVAPA